MTRLEKNMDTGVLIKKGSLYAITALVISAIAASWSFTWNAAADRTKLIESVNTHMSNQYIHNMDDKLVTEKEMKLYFKEMNRRFDNLEKGLEELKERR